MDLQPHLRRLAIAGFAALLLGACASYQADPAQEALHQADRAMGGTSLKSLRYSATGSGGFFGQAYVPGMAWPRINVTTYDRLLDYETGSLREEIVITRAEPTGGGGAPVMGAGEQRSIGLLRGDQAWNMRGPAAAPSPASVVGRAHDLWTTPHGVLKAGMKQPATLRVEGNKRIVSFAEPGRFKAVVWINAEGFVERIDSTQPNPVLGDMPAVTLYSGYRDFNGVKFPTRIRQNSGGFNVLDLDVRNVEPNAASGIEVPAAVPQFAEQVAVEKAAEGIWFLSGGSHNSVLIELQDHTVLVESPLYDGRAAAVIAEARRLVPGKPIRYAVNSHHHFDHAGGVRTAAAEGITLVTSEQARPWFERVLANPNTIAPDAFAKSGNKAVVTGVNGQRSLGDATRQVEVFFIEESIHAQGFMLVWLPRERILVEADAYTPGAPNAAPPARPDADNVNLVVNIERLKLDPERILPLHGRMVPATELYTAAGRKP